ncbi:trehalase-associated protein [Scheffersomyces amazonensis]|uniref:trehalase-associated protein n=1 Tax=Scheffersomyces amazonensis TaxID=1078765 RepID=UPI00315D0808
MSVNEFVNKFQFKELLKSDPQTKSIVLLGTIDSQDAIISLEKSHFLFDSDHETDLNKLVKDSVIINHNDVYYWSNVLLEQTLNEFPTAKLNLIYPATATHIKKYCTQQVHYIIETPDMYKKYVIPYIETMKGDRIKWVYNILFEGKESETFIHHDKHPQLGFVLLPDMKWDTLNLQSLYLCCIVNRKDISSIRDLNGSHLDFLKQLKSTILQLVEQKYPLSQDQVRIFIHYQPSYYHFHLHIVNVAHPGLGDGIAVGKAILLDDVIENISIKDDYYQVRNIGYLLGENHGLWQIEGYRNSI